jgi:hypothetical protein
VSIVRAASDWDDLREKVDENGGTAVVTMGVIRTLAGFGKLGRHVNAQAALQMAANGLGHFPFSPDEFPVYQHENIRIYLKGKGVDRLYQRMLRIPDDDRVAARDDAFISDVATSQAKEKLDKVKAIVCED